MGDKLEQNSENAERETLLKIIEKNRSDSNVSDEDFLDMILKEQTLNKKSKEETKLLEPKAKERTGGFGLKLKEIIQKSKGSPNFQKLKELLDKRSPEMKKIDELIKLVSTEVLVGAKFGNKEQVKTISDIEEPNRSEIINFLRDNESKLEFNEFGFNEEEATLEEILDELNKIKEAIKMKEDVEKFRKSIRKITVVNPDGNIEVSKRR